MKYSGSITILDDEGNAVFEKELATEEMLEILIDARKRTIGFEVPKGQESQAVETFARAAEREAGEETPRARKVRGGGKVQGKECCGSLGKRHKKDCPGTEKPALGRNRRTVDNRHPFSEPTWKRVKTSLDHEPVDIVSVGMGLELEEVRRTNLSDDYQDYLTIA